MSDMTTADGHILPEPLRRQIHNYGFYKSSEGRHVGVTVLEIEHPATLWLTLVEDTKGWEFLAIEYHAGLVAQRLLEGWALFGTGPRHYVLTRPTDPGSDGAQ